MNNENLEFQLTFSKIIRISWIIMLILSIVVIIISLFFDLNYWYSWSVSYLLGAIVNLFAFNLLKNNISSLTSEVKRGITNSFSNYVIRFAIYGFVLYIAFTSDKLNPYFVAGGFLTVRIAIYIFSLLNKE